MFQSRTRQSLNETCKDTDVLKRIVQSSFVLFRVVMGQNIPGLSGRAGSVGKSLRSLPSEMTYNLQSAIRSAVGLLRLGSRAHVHLVKWVGR